MSVDIFEDKSIELLDIEILFVPNKFDAVESIVNVSAGSSVIEIFAPATNVILFCLLLSKLDTLVFIFVIAPCIVDIFDFMVDIFP